MPSVLMYFSQPMPWTRQRPMVVRRVHSMIFWRPVGPSFCRAFKLGRTLARSWKMIEAEI